MDESRKLGSNLPSYGQIELWDDEKCETKLNEWWCASNVCMIVFMLCCNVRKEMRVSDVMLQNAL